MFALLSPKVWLELAIVALITSACWYGYSWVYDRGADSVQRKWDSVEKERSDQSAKISADALATTKSLQDSSDLEKKVKNAQITKLNDALAVAVAGLSNRPARPAPGSVPTDTGTRKGCYPAELYREDASVVTKLAGEADQLRIELKACYAIYDRAAAALK